MLVDLKGSIWHSVTYTVQLVVQRMSIECDRFSVSVFHQIQNVLEESLTAKTKGILVSRNVELVNQQRAQIFQTLQMKYTTDFFFQCSNRGD